MFVESIALIQTQPCLAYPGKIIVIGQPCNNLTEALPYLATLPNVIGYNPTANSLTLRRQPGFITLLSDRVYITQVSDVDEGLELLTRLAYAINATWKHRYQLKPITEPHCAPRLLDIWSLLPQTNCKECGEATCMSFAAELIQHRRTLAECVPLMTEDTLIDQRAALIAMI